jgi:spermidine/putrescine transport system ATP-binding protein
MSDRIAVMNLGRVLQIGSPVEIYERPNCRFVADFIGETNFLEGMVKSRQGDEVVVTVSKLDVDISCMAGGEIQVGNQAILSVRPEKIRICKEPPGDRNIFKAKVVETAYIGSDTRFILDAAGDTRLSIWEQNKSSTLDANAYYRQGQEVWLYLPMENTLALPE